MALDFPQGVNPQPVIVVDESLNPLGISADGVIQAQIVDGSGNSVDLAPAPLANYVFLASGAGQTVKGIYVDADGAQVGASFSLAINQADGTNDALGLPTIPEGAVGAIVRFSGTTYVGLGGATSDDFEDNYANYPFFIAADGDVPLGRVNAGVLRNGSSGSNVAIGQTATAGDTTIATGGTAQNLFSGSTPSNGFWVFNNDSVEELWVRDSGTAAANGTGSVRVGPQALYETPPGYKPVGAVSVIAATTGHKITARYW